MAFNIILVNEPGQMDNSTIKKVRRHTSSISNSLSDPHELALVPFDSNKEEKTQTQHLTGSFMLLLKCYRYKTG